MASSYNFNRGKLTKLSADACWISCYPRQYDEVVAEQCDIDVTPGIRPKLCSEDGFGNNEVGGGSNPSNVAIRSREILAAANHGLEFGRMRSYLRRGGQVGDAVGWACATKPARLGSTPGRVKPKTLWRFCSVCRLSSSRVVFVSAAQIGWSKAPRTRWSDAPFKTRARMWEPHTVWHCDASSFSFGMFTFSFWNIFEFVFAWSKMKSAKIHPSPASQRRPVLVQNSHVALLIDCLRAAFIISEPKRPDDPVLAHGHPGSTFNGMKRPLKHFVWFSSFSSTLQNHSHIVTRFSLSASVSFCFIWILYGYRSDQT